MSGAKFTMYLLVPIPAPKAVRESAQAQAGDITLELCERCWSPHLAGKRDEHLAAIPHRQPPLAADTPEG
jgi:hypothetical protein